MTRKMRRALAGAVLLISADSVLLAARWVPIGPPGGVGISQIAVDPSTPTTLYTSVSFPHARRGVYKSVNGGVSWSPAKTGLGSIDIEALSIDPGRPGVLYAGGTDYDNGNVGRGVFKSTDGGATWSSVNNGLANLFVHALAIDPSNSEILYASVNYGMCRTRDGGASWSALPLPATIGIGDSVGAIAIDPTSSNTVYAATSRGVIKSTDSGSSWTFMNNGLVSTEGFISISPGAIAINPGSPGEILIHYLGPGLVFRTSDGARSWTPVRAGLPQDAYLHAIAFSRGSVPVAYVGTDRGLYLSTDGSSTWGPAPGLEEDRIEALATDPVDRSKVYAATIKSLFRSDDAAATWSPISEGISGLSTVLAFAPGPRGNLYAGTNWGGVFRSPDGGRSWVPTGPGIAEGFVQSLVVDPGAGSTVYAGGRSVWKSLDAGDTWSISQTNLLGLYFPALVMDPGNPSTLYAGTLVEADTPLGAGIFKSTDGGKTWSLASNGLACNRCSYPAVRALAVDPGHPSTIYASAFSFYSGSGLFKTLDGGTSWNRIADRVPSALAIDPRPPSTVYADGFRSVDGGVTWIATVLANSLVYSLTFDPRSGAVYAGTFNEGVFRSFDRGATWSSIGDRLADLGVVSLALDPSGAFLYAGTDSAGAFKLFLEDSTERPPTRVVPRRRP